MNVNIPGDFRHAAAKESTRYAISGVEVRRVSEDRVLISATNGRVLATRIQDGIGPEDPTIVPQDLLPTAKSGGVVSADGEGRLQLRQGTKTLVGEPEAGAFPPFADVIPQVGESMSLDAAQTAVDEAIEHLVVDEPKVEAALELLRTAQQQLGRREVQVLGINANLLANLAKAVTAGDVEPGRVTLIIHRKPGKPICVLPHGNRDSLGVIMPVTVEDLGDVAADWERRRSDVLDALNPDRVRAREEREAKRAESQKKQGRDPTPGEAEAAAEAIGHEPENTS